MTMTDIEWINLDLMMDEEHDWCQGAAMVEEWLHHDMRWYADFMEFPEE